MFNVRSNVYKVLIFVTSLMLFGTNIQASTVEEFGKDYLVQGMNLSCSCFDGNYGKSHTKESYKELKDMGFNTVRLCLNSKWFNDSYVVEDYIDSEGNSTYKWNEKGWNIINENISWAKAHDMKIVLNQHIPDGGYQSMGKGMSFWIDVDIDGNLTYPGEGVLTKNQKRTIEFWKEVARRYSNEETIIAYDLVNEPIVPCLNDEGGIAKTLSEIGEEGKKKTYEQYPRIASIITEGIRKYDKNHTILVEPTAKARIVNMEKGKLNVFSKADEYNPKYIRSKLWDLDKYMRKFDNWGVEIHVYSPSDIALGDLYDTKKTLELTDDVKKQTLDICKEISYWRDGTYSSSGNWLEGTGRPVFIGEFTVSNLAFSQGKVATDTMEFLFDVFKEYNFNYSWWQYKGKYMSLYQQEDNTLPHKDNRNETMASEFYRLQKGSNISVEQKDNTVEITINSNTYGTNFETDLLFDEDKLEIADIKVPTNYKYINKEGKILISGEDRLITGDNIVSIYLKPKVSFSGDLEFSFENTKTGLISDNDFSVKCLVDLDYNENTFVKEETSVVKTSVEPINEDRNILPNTGDFTGNNNIYKAFYMILIYYIFMKLKNKH